MSSARRPTVFDQANEEALAHFGRTGWLLTRALTADAAEQLRGWVGEVSSWPDGGGGWLHYREQTSSGPSLCRTENFVPFHGGLRTLLTTGRMLDVASALLGERAVLYKEKINYKLPGGAGYSPHQDAPAYPFIDMHVSCMLAVDDATVNNGGLEVVSGAHGAILPSNDRGCIRDDVVASLSWTPVEVRPGEALWFHSRTPHRSGPNRSAAPRRAIYPTYNATSEGDRRGEYYQEKLTEFAAGEPEKDRVQVSLIGDFEGLPVR